MKKLFISQPMRGKTDEEIRAERERAIGEAETLLGEKVEIIDSLFADFSGNALTRLAESIELLAKSDIVYFAKGWKNARGCRIEHECAVEYGIDRIEVNEEAEDDV